MNSYIRYSDNIKVSHLKMSKSMYDSLEEALVDSEKKDSKTILYNDFSSMVDAYYFHPDNKGEDYSFALYKKTPSQKYFDFVYGGREVPTIIDYNIHNKENYEYLGVVGTPDSKGEYSYNFYLNKDAFDQETYATTNWKEWSICSIEETNDEGVYTKVGDTWLLGLNLEEENLTQNLSITTYETLGRFPKVSMGEKDYSSGSITCLLGKMEEVTYTEEVMGDLPFEQSFTRYQYTEMSNSNSQNLQEFCNNNKSQIYPFKNDRYGREIEKYEKWKSFCADGKTKLLKDSKGNSWIVAINEPPSSRIDPFSFVMPTTITFSWVEIIDVKNVNIINIGEW